MPLAGGGVLRTYTDITERRRSDEQIRYRARHDGLTSLINRDTFVEILGARVNESALEGTRFAVHYMDLDRFKPINDSLGHAIGDRVLALVADRLRHATREGDIVARMGGDEFALIQSRVEAHEQVTGLAQRIVLAFETPLDVETDRGSVDVSVGVSVGVAIFPTHALTPELLLRSADRALYQVKCEGGHGVRMAAPIEA